jgi:hypothetical protein
MDVLAFSPLFTERTARLGMLGPWRSGSGNRSGRKRAPAVSAGAPGLVLERSRNRRRGLDLINPFFDPQERTYRVCPTCGARHRLIDGQPI